MDLVHRFTPKVEKILNQNPFDLDKSLLKICKLLKTNIIHFDWVGFYFTNSKKTHLELKSFYGTPTEHKKIPFGNITSINDRLKTSTSANWYKPFPTNKPEKLDSLLKLYYMYLYEDDVSKERQVRDLYWFDNEVLSKYKGKIVHCWGFDVTYEFKNGIMYRAPLIDMSRSDRSLPRVGKFSVPKAKFLANEVFTLLNN